MRTLPYKHYFTVKDNKYVWDDPDIFKLRKKQLEGKRGYAIIEEDENGASTNQLAYYFGGIIRQECMNSDCFAGWSEREIHMYLLGSVRGSVREVYVRGVKIMKEMPGDFDHIKNHKEEMTKYIEEVIAFLSTEHEIYPKPSEHYKKTNKFRNQTKHYK